MLIGYYTGARRGLALQLVHVLGYLITYILAANLFQPFARFLEMYVPYPNILPDSTIHIYDTALHLKLDRIFYNGVAFVGIMLLGWLITRLLARMVQFITLLPIIKQLNTIGGGILGLAMNVFFLCIIFTLLATIPLPEIQAWFTPGSLPTLIAKNTPIISQQLFQWWTTNINW